MRTTRLAAFASLIPLLGASVFWLGLTAGDSAPDFAAKNQDGKVVRLSEFRGKPVLIYFYPKDDTPGCTKEACSFRDEFSKFQKMGAVVIGVSRQDSKSHQEFHTKYHLPFDLLTDTDGKLAGSFGVGLMPVVGFTKRQSALVSPDGKLIRFYPDVDPAKHTAQVLQDLETYAAHAGKASG
jgi:peroxiredoxin Q/BCP